MASSGPWGTGMGGDWVTAAMPGVAFKALTRVCRASVGFVPPISTLMASGPLKPGPNPLASRS